MDMGQKASWQRQLRLPSFLHSDHIFMGDDSVMDPPSGFTAAASWPCNFGSLSPHGILSPQHYLHGFTPAMASLVESVTVAAPGDAGNTGACGVLVEPFMRSLVESRSKQLV